MPPPATAMLATMDAQGHRRWLEPTLTKGVWWQRRLVIAWILIAVYAFVPFVEFDGLPLVQFDIPARRLIFFGTILRPTDTILLALFTLIIFVSIFWLTAIYGRAWCGWMCPQTIYLEYVYRPLQVLLVGTRRPATPRSGAAWRYPLLGLLYIVVSAHLSNTFIAWFVGAQPLTSWIFKSPTEHPVAFTTFLLMTAAILFQFGYFREQLCSIVCPYGRFQSVLLDRFSLIVGYDAKRGEPRGKRGTTSGHCVDCSMCVRTCPAGIDIRRGLQMECVHCTQCIDACDRVMVTLRLPTGLIRYGSQENLELGTRSRWLRPRVVIYPLLLGVLITVFSTLLFMRTPIALTQLRIQDERVMMESTGEIRTPVRVRLDNRTSQSMRCEIAAVAPDLLVAEATVLLPAFGSADAEVIMRSEASAFAMGRRTAKLRVSDEHAHQLDAEVTLLGPMTLPPEKSGRFFDSQPQKTGGN